MVTPRSAARRRSQQTLPSCRPPSACHGLISCLYSSCDEDHAAGASSSQDTKTTKEVLYDRIVNLYEDALDRLPWEDTPELVHLMSTAGLCVGLLDPVSNIILNTVSLLPPGFLNTASSHSPGFQEARPRKSRRLAAKAIAADCTKKSTFYDIAWRSSLALTGFLLDYFGCLTKEQAARYLRWADADLALAVRLVEYDLYSSPETDRLVPDPGSGRTRASLEVAVRRAGHPAPDRLVQLTTSLFPQQWLEAVKPLLLAGGTKLTVHDVDLLRRLLQDSGAASDVHLTVLPQGGLVTRVLKQAVDQGVVAVETSDHGNGYQTTTVKPAGDYISSLRSAKDMDDQQNLCLIKVPTRSMECGQSCEHLQSLEMRVRGTIHSLYLDAIALLPCEDASSLIPDILVAGHCYGPLAPVANIIVNSIWHNRSCPLPVADHNAQQYDILDTLSLLRTEVRSLEGLMEAVRAMAPTLSTKDVVKSLILTRCDITQMLRRTARSSDSDPFLRAAVAARHPLPAALALLHKQLAEDAVKMDNLRSVISTAGGVLSVADLDRIADILNITPQPRVQASLQPQLHKDAV